MTDISRGAGSRIARSVRKTERADDNSEDEVQASGIPILLVRAQEDIASGDTGPVRRLVRASLSDDKGSEEEVGDEFDVYNRFADIEEGDDFFIRWSDGGYESLSRGATSEVSGLTCGSCNQLPGTFEKDIGDGVMAALTYEVAVTCGGESVTLSWDSSLTWLSETVNVDCNGPTSLDLNLTVTGYLPGDVTLTANTNEGVWVNETAWQPETAIVLRLTSFDPDCPCSPWQPYVCLVPTPEE